MSPARPASGESAWYGRVSTSRSATLVEKSSTPRPSERPALNATLKQTIPQVKKTAFAPVVGWPSQPQPLRRGGFVAGFSGLTDCLMVIISSVFFIHGVFVFQYDRVPTKDIPNLKLLQDAARYGPTLFPIFFAAIVGQAMHAIALARLESGERLQVLDQLLGSTTIFATVTTQLKYWRMGILGFSLIILWSFSPLGGQASLRILEFAFYTVSSSATLLYLNLMDSRFQPGMSGRTIVYMSDAPLTHGLVAASLMAPMAIKNSSMDTWGNAKVPFIEVAAQNTTPDDQGWYQLTPDNTVYSSLIGLPMASMGESVNTTFSVDTNYMTLNCTTLGDPLELGVASYFNQTAILVPDQDPDITTYTNPCWGIATNLQLLNYTESQRRSNATDPTMQPRMILYKSVDDDDDMTHAECEIRLSYVELDISCVGRNCTSTRIRASRNPHKPTAWTPLEFGGYKEFFQTLLEFHPCSDMNQQAIPLHRYFTKPQSPYDPTPTGRHAHNLTKAAFGHRLAQLFNTFYIAGTGLTTVPNNLPGTIPGGVNVSNILPAGLLAHDAQVRVSSGELVLVCNHVWLTVLLVATALMFLLGVWGLVLEHMRRTPDLAMNISGMTRDNPYVDIPEGGTVMDAAERMRRLRDVRVRFGDVKPDEKVGWVAIATYTDGVADEEDGEEGRFVDVLQEGRVYA